MWVSKVDPSKTPWAKAGWKHPDAVVCDIDGVLAIHTTRTAAIFDVTTNELVEEPQWDEFFMRADEDAVVRGVRGLLRPLRASANVILLSSRPVRSRGVTVRWLQQHDIQYDALILRPNEGYQLEGGDAWKIRHLEALARDLHIAAVIEDDPKIFGAMLLAGYPVVPVYSGYYPGDYPDLKGMQDIHCGYQPSLAAARRA